MDIIDSQVQQKWDKQRHHPIFHSQPCSVCTASDPFGRAPQIYTTLRAQGTYTNGIYSMCIMYSGQRGSSSTD